MCENNFTKAMETEESILTMNDENVVADDNIHTATENSSEPILVNDVDVDDENKGDSIAHYSNYSKALHSENETVGKLNDISSKLDALCKAFEEKIKHSEHEKKIVDQMHKELQKYKEDMYSQLVRPILLDIIEIRDSISRVAVAHLSKPDGEQSIPNKTFATYIFDIQEVLVKNNIEIYKSEVGTEFVPVRQRIVKKTMIHDQDLHGRVAESLSDGYNYNGKTISAEKIAVYYYEAPPNEPAENTEGEN